MGVGQLALVAAAVAATLSAAMAVAWVIQQKTGKSGWVDVSWSINVGTVAALAAVWPLAWDRLNWRQMTVAALAAAWGMRLGLHLAARTRSGGDDPRYHKLAQDWGGDARRRMFWFLQSQAAVGAVLAFSIVIAASHPDPAIRVQDAIGLAILVIALLGEAMADRQLRAFKADPGNRLRVCDDGLWRWSRHPNYFFEWLVWVALPVIAIDLRGAFPAGWLTLAAPACMYWVLVHVSGIPPLEEHMLRTRGAAFRDYQWRTRVFFPWPKG